MKDSRIKSTFYRLLQNSFLAALVGLLVVSCGDVNLNGPSNESAHMNVHLTDAPADYQEVNIDVQGLRIHYTPSESDTVSSDGKWIDLPVEPMTVNLLNLTNGVDTLLSSADLDPGTYKELRLILGDNNTVMVDSMTQDLKVPSGQQSGFKIKFKTELNAGEELDVTIDFDAGQSVHKAGKSGKYILKPVLKAFVESGDEVTTGSIGGTVEPSEADPSIYAIMDDDTTSTKPDDEGGFLIQGLEDGQYDLSVVPSNEQYSDTTLTGITVEEGEETNVGTITLSENE